MAVDALYGSAGELPTEIGHLLAAQGGAPRLVELNVARFINIPLAPLGLARLIAPTNASTLATSA